MKLLDFSFQHPTIQQIKATGAGGVMRYLTRSTSIKRLTAAEASICRAAGLWVGVVFEDGAARAGQGFQAGHDDAVFAAAQARSIGVPTSCPIFYAVDFDTTAAKVAPYFQGIASAHNGYPVGVYGSASVVDGVMGAGLAAYGWQTVAWSRGVRSTRAHLFQTGTSSLAGTDDNTLLKPLPLWGAPAAGPAIPTPSWFRRTLRLGMRGDDVITLQTKLGMPNVSRNVFKVFGPATVYAVKRRQHGLRLPETGVCDATLARRIG